MTEPVFREIQLTKKQLVFLFMASVVLAAVVFLLGVSLGRQLPASATGVQVGEPLADATMPVDMPPPTVLTPDDQKYASELQGGKVPPAEPQPPPAVQAAPPKPSPSAASVPAVTEPPVGSRADGAVRPALPAQKPLPSASPAAAPPEPGTVFLQINAFRSRANADAEVRKLAAKGHKALVSPSGSLFRVRVGPFADRAAADKAMAALRRDGFSPQLTGR
jgi:DedD protein